MFRLNRALRSFCSSNDKFVFTIKQNRYRRGLDDIRAGFKKTVAGLALTGALVGILGYPFVGVGIAMFSLPYINSIEKLT